MALPLLLAGPILRRVDPTLVAVWVALSRPADVTLKVWEGQLKTQDADTASPFAASDRTTTLGIGERLHLALVTARIAVQSGKEFRPDTAYCYDVELDVGNPKPFTLATLGMLDDKVDSEGVAHVPLGYDADLLPSFAPCPSELTDLRIVYGSCRRPAHPNPDAMVWIDDFVNGLIDPENSTVRRYEDPRERPHQLFLGGDQIYADDVHRAHMLMLFDLAQELIGSRPEAGEFTDKRPLEDVDVGSVLVRKSTPAGPAGVDPEDPLTAYRDPEPNDKASTLLPSDRAHFPQDQRKDLTLRAAQFSGTDGANHLLSLGEFAAMYLSVWSNAVWPKQVPHGHKLPNPADDLQKVPLSWDDDLKTSERIEYDKPDYPQVIPEHLYLDRPVPKPDKRTPEKRKADEAEAERKRQRSHRQGLRIHGRFVAGLPRVRRVLANIPTYMILDDHDVTDDYFLNPVWRQRVLGSSLGKTILRNAMVTYALFQDWGNDPVKYDSGVPAQLLQRATELFPSVGPNETDIASRPIAAAAAELDRLLGHTILENPRNVSGRYDAVKPPITWHFKVDGPKHRVVALDNRTRRSYVSDMGPPGNVSPEALLEQIPPPPLPADIEVLLVVAPLQVIGPPVIDEMLAPNLYRIYDFFGGLSKNSDINPSSRTGKRGMTGTNPDAIEAWALDAETYEHLLARLAEFGRVVLLSGDVHNSSGTEMSYWRREDEVSRRIIQFTSSGFKNVMPGEIRAVDVSAGFAQQMVRANLGVERLGWLHARKDLVILPDGKTLLDVSRATRKRLRAEPVMIPTWGWPPNSRLNPDQPPDWRWRTKPLVDGRDDLERPEPIQPTTLDAAQITGLLANPKTAVQAYQKLAARHQSSLGKLRNARQILFRSNFGLVRFEHAEDGTLLAVHEVYTDFTDPGDINPDAAGLPEPYLRQTASLEPLPDEELPGEELRDRPIKAAPRGNT